MITTKPIKNTKTATTIVDLTASRKKAILPTDQKFISDL